MLMRLTVSLLLALGCRPFSAPRGPSTSWNVVLPTQGAPTWEGAYSKPAGRERDSNQLHTSLRTWSRAHNHIGHTALPLLLLRSRSQVPPTAQGRDSMGVGGGLRAGGRNHWEPRPPTLKSASSRARASAPPPLLYKCFPITS